MARYRLYPLTPEGYAQTAYTIEATDDGEAIELARVRVEHADIELWCRRRKVAFVPKDGLAIISSPLASA